MGRILTIAHHTVREAVRMKVVMAFAVLILALICGLPFGLQRPNATVTATVQTFLTWSLTPLGVILSFLAVFLGCLSISDEMYHRQIYTLVSKPIPRWQYIVGKWLGVVQVLTGLLIFAGLLTYVMARVLASAEPVDEIDKFTLEHEVLTARAHSPLHIPDYTALAERVFAQLKADGRYSESSPAAQRAIKARIIGEYTQRWRNLALEEVREFEFRDLGLVERSSENSMQLRYKAKGLSYTQDETLQMVWVFGDPRNADVYGPVLRRDVMDRYHVISFPASCVSPNGVLKVRVQNADRRADGRSGATIAFEAVEGFEVFYKIGSFEGNLARTLFLIWCRVVLIASLAIMSATFLSYPVACLLTFMFYVLSVSGGYVVDALGFGGAQDGVYGVAKPFVKAMLEIMFWLLPKFSKYDGVSTFVEGRNVTLMWDLLAMGKLVLFLSTLILLIACIIFRRRQVAELSV
ncbi:MAG: ABC transporter permease subunit [Planctomycetes bacterium]|nr:ABC transporter permease subunit [Planctomycetota bacterium]